MKEINNNRLEKLITLECCSSVIGIVIGRCWEMSMSFLWFKIVFVYYFGL